MLLRRLHQADAWVGEHRHQILQPVRMHDIVGVDDADDLGVGRGALHGDAQRAGLEALHLLGVDELEALAERAAVVLDRLPELRIGRVVDDADAFEIRIVEPRHRIERLLQHLDRLEIGGDVDRDLREGDVLADGGGRQRRALGDQPARTAAEGDRRDFVDARHRDQDQRHQQDQAERQRERRAEHEIVPGPVGEHGGSPGADAVGGGRKHQRLHDGRLLDPQDRQRHQDADQERDRRQLPVVLVHDRAGPREFRFARRIENAPIGSDAAFEEFPGLIDRLDDVVVHADGFGAGDEIAQHRGLLERSGVGVPQIIAGARPAEFGDHDPLSRETGRAAAGTSPPPDRRPAWR